MDFIGQKRYQIIYADPPWRYADKLGSHSAKMGSCEYHYDTMSPKQLRELPVTKISDKDCALFLWVTMPKLNEVFDLITAWGFTYKTVAFTWIKLNPKAGTVFKGIGRWVQGNAELVLLCTKGRPHRVSKSVSQVVLAKRGAHSQKPVEVRNRIIQLMGDLPRIELFARVKTPGWDVWGNELKSDIKMDA